MWVGLLGATLIFGCSAEKRYRALSTFFDGVPDPNATVRANPTALLGTPIGNQQTSTAKAYQHKPFAEKRCADCHTTNNTQLVSTQADLCVKCHQPELHQYAKMHGPVTAGKCLWCHEPHESDQPKLLKVTASDLCLQCHDRSLLSPKVVDHANEQANCLVCHSGHGSPKPGMLRADNPGVGPASALLLNPATQPASAEGGTQ
jgi:predicted CXXCH cytochrome family protein